MKKAFLKGLIIELSLLLCAIVCLSISIYHSDTPLIVASACTVAVLLYISGGFLCEYIGVSFEYFGWISFIRKSVLSKILICLLALILILSPVLFVCAYALSIPPVYSETFYGALNEKYGRLNSLEGEKIVVVGGSSVAFGLDSELLESYTGMPVVNFGLYADLGTKMMLDLSLSGISNGDVVILAPEMDRQTLSLYFNNDSALMALDDEPAMMRHLAVDDMLSCVGGMWKFAQDKRERQSGSWQRLWQVRQMCHSSQFRVRTSWRCLWAWALRVCATCSNRQRRRLRASSLSMRLMLSVVRVVRTLVSRVMMSARIPSTSS